MTYAFVLLGLAGLFLGGDWLVRGASGLARGWGLSPLVIGATVVGFGTSSPELLVSLAAALQGQPGIALGNVVGSNIANLWLILGIAALIAPIAVLRRDVLRDLGWMTGATLLLPLALWSGWVGRIEGLLLVAGLAAYILHALRGPAESAELPEGLSRGQTRNAALTLYGLLTIMAGAQLLVQGATDLARTFGVSEAMIGLSIVAVGTSLPELATTVMAALRGQRDIALGNILGSNVFNTLGILGATALISPLPVEARFLSFDVPVLIAVSLITVALLWVRHGIGRIGGVLMLAGYAGYIWWGASL